jgi:hypothetical protein
MVMKIRKRYLVIAILLIAIPVVIWVGRSIFLDLLKDKLEGQIYKLRDSGYIVSYDSITINYKKNSVQVDNLYVKSAADTGKCHQSDFLFARKVRAQGLDIMTLLLKRHLSFNSILVDSSFFVINENFLRKDSTKRERKEFTIMVDNIKFPSLNFRYYNSGNCRTGSTFNGNVVVRDFSLSIYEDRPLFADASYIGVDSVEINIPDEFYRLDVDQLAFYPHLKALDMDSLKIKPYHGKIAFGRKKGKEVDRIEGLVPYVKCEGIGFFNNDSLTILSEKITAQAFIKVFRDKRLPFRNPLRPLPLEALNNLGIGIDIEKVVLDKSFVQYEEIAEEADSSGAVYFDNLYATIEDINNVDLSRKGKTTMSAEANFLGRAKVKMKALFPWNTAKNHHVSGTIENLDMRTLNVMTEPAINVRIESGNLKRASFNFSASSYHSKGTVEMDYNDLKLLTYKSEKRIKRIMKRRGELDEEEEEKVRKASLKTFIVNNFILKKDSDMKEPSGEMKGEIDFDRDTHKAIFNYWWKSLLSGIKSAYNIDKLEDSKLAKKLNRKEKG